MLPCSSTTLALALLPQATRPAPELTAERAPFGLGLTLAAGERLLEYTWDAGAPVPSLASGARVEVPFGERGLVPLARLYLPGNSLSEAPFTGASVLVARALALGPGRLGPALALQGESYAHYALPAQPDWALGWTLSLWVRPEGAAFGRKILRMPGVLELELRADGRPRADVLGGGPEIVHPAGLAPERWSRLVVSYDPLFSRQLRFLVDDVQAHVQFAAAALARTPSELELGDLAGAGQGFVGALDELLLEALPQSTAAARRAAPEEGLAGPHRLELVTTRGLRTLEPVAEPLPTLVLGTSADFQAGELEGVAVEDGGLRWVPARWRRVDTQGAPAARTTHPTVALGGGRTLVFGGETRDTDVGLNVNTNDTWIYERSSERWERIATALAPPPRCHVPAAYSPDHDLVLLAGGWKNDAQPHVSYDDTWVFHVAERRWEQRFPGGAVLPAASDFGLVYLPALQRFALFHDVYVYLYDPLADAWELRQPPAFTPAGQPTSWATPGSAMCGLDPATGRVVLFGGHTGPTSQVFHDTTALYDPSADAFVVLAPAVHPSARVRSAFAYDVEHARFVLFGGVRDQFSPRFDDLWTFDPFTRTWSELGCSNRPGPVGGLFGMAYDADAAEFVLFGGRSAGSLWLDETQVLTMEPERAGTARYTIDRLQARHARSWFADASTPGDSTVTFQFRTSRGGASWSAWSSTLALGATERYLQVLATLTPGSAGEVPSVARMGLR